MVPPLVLQGESLMDLRGEISTIGAFHRTGREEEEADSAIKGGKIQERDTELSQYKPKRAFVMSCDDSSLKLICLKYNFVEIKYTLPPISLF